MLQNRTKSIGLKARSFFASKFKGSKEGFNKDKLLK